MDYVTFIFFNGQKMPQVIDHYTLKAYFYGDHIETYDKYGNLVFLGGSNNE